MKLRQGIAAITILLAAYAGSSAQAVERKCLVAEIGAMLGGRTGAEGVDTAQYARANSMLFLSDSGDTTMGGLSLGSLIAQTYPEKTILRTDFAFRGEETVGNLTTRFLDNTQPLPFRDNSFDIIVMRRGLCICHGSRVCGGFLPISDESRQFFSEVTRILNKNNPEAKAVLEGGYGVFPHVEEAWTAVGQKLEETQGIAMDVYTSPWGGFHSIVISPKKGH